jgi:glucose dehydrogenase
VLTTATLALGWGSSSEHAKAKDRQTALQVPAVATPDDGRWLMASKDYATNRFSGLTEINTGNVRNLQLAWTFSTGVLRGHEGGPLVQKKKAWILEEKFPAWVGALAAAGDIVVYGTMARWFKALNARTGDLLWQFRTGSGIIGQPINFKGPGKQSMAITDGVGGWSGAMKDLPEHTGKGGTFYVFSLP